MRDAEVAGLAVAREVGVASVVVGAAVDGAWAAAVVAFGVAAFTVATKLFTGCSRIRKNGFGASPIQNAMINSGTNVATSRGVRSCSFSFFGFVTVPKNTR